MSLLKIPTSQKDYFSCRSQNQISHPQNCSDIKQSQKSSKSTRRRISRSCLTKNSKVCCSSSRASSLQTICNPLPGCASWETVKQNKLQTLYNRRKSNLIDLSKENKAMLQRINNQKSNYLPKGMKINLLKKQVENVQKNSQARGDMQKSRGSTHQRLRSVKWDSINKENIKGIDEVLQARHKEIKVILSEGYSAFQGNSTYRSNNCSQKRNSVF